MIRRLIKYAAILAAFILLLAAAGLSYLYFRITGAVYGHAPETASVVRYAELGPDVDAAPPVVEQYDFDPARFADPGGKFGPMTRWWWPGADVGRTELEREIALFAETGFAGVEIQPFTMGLNPDADAADRGRVMSWDSDAYYEKLRGVLVAAAEKGLIVDLNGGSGWPTGGPQIALEDNFLTLLFNETEVSGGREVRLDLEPPEPPLTAYLSLALAGLFGGEARGVYFPQAAKLVAVSAAKMVRDERSPWVWNTSDQVALDPASAVDLSAKASDRVLTWQAPEGDWRIVSFWSMPDGEAPSLIAKSPAGFVVDHFSPDKVRANYDYLFGSRTGLPAFYGKPLRAIFNDSYEFKADRHFTSDFFEEFQKRRGYDIRPWLPAVMEPGYNHMLAHLMAPPSRPDFVFSDQDRRLRYDYDRTLSDLLISGFLDTSADWMSRRGLQHRTQPYGMAMDVIAAAGHADIPETEQLYWGGSEAFLKSVASGAWLYNRPIVSSESVVYMNREYMSTPQKIKISVDKALTSGVNQIIYHGTAYRYLTKDFGEFGWYPWSSPFAAFLGFSTDLRESNPFWKFVPQLNRYIARSQYALRSGRPSVDVLLYYPFLGFLINEEELNPEELLPRGEFVGVEPPLQPQSMPWMPKLNEKGKSPTQQWLAQVWETINKLEELGVAWAWVNDESLQQAEYARGRWRIRGGDYQALILPYVPFIRVETVAHLRELAEQGAAIAIVGDPPGRQPSFRDYQAQDRAVVAHFSRIASLDNVAQLPAADSLAVWSMPLARPIRYHEPYRHLRQIHRSMSNGDRVAFIRSKANDWTEIELDLDSGMRSLTWLNPDDGSMRDSGDGSYRLPPYGSVIAYASARARPPGVSSRQVGDPEPDEAAVALDDWKLEAGEFKLDHASLGDWRDQSELRFAGEAVYRTQIELSALDPRSGYVLDLGNVSATAEVTVNGTPIGAAIYAPYALDITDALQQGSNALEVRVTAPAINRLLGKAARGDPGYGQFKGKESSAMPAGLFGPVRLRKIVTARP